jgi:biopolymer transport protein ExbB
MDQIQYFFFTQGGVSTYPLVVLGIMAAVLFLERVFFLHKSHIGVEDFVSGIKNLVKKDRLLEALTLCEETPGPIPRVVKAALLHYGNSREALFTAIKTAALLEVPLLERRVAALASIASIAPLVGFLGTILAIARAVMGFDAANSNSREFSIYLGEALFSSALGIGIGLLALLGYHFIYGRVKMMLYELEWQGHGIYEFMTCLEPKSASGNGDSTKPKPE